MKIKITLSKSFKVGLFIIGCILAITLIAAITFRFAFGSWEYVVSSVAIILGSMVLMIFSIYVVLTIICWLEQEKHVEFYLRSPIGVRRVKGGNL